MITISLNKVIGGIIFCIGIILILTCWKSLNYTNVSKLPEDYRGGKEIQVRGKCEQAISVDDWCQANINEDYGIVQDICKFISVGELVSLKNNNHVYIFVDFDETEVGDYICLTGYIYQVGTMGIVFGKRITLLEYIPRHTDIKRCCQPYYFWIGLVLVITGVIMFIWKRQIRL